MSTKERVPFKPDFIAGAIAGVAIAGIAMVIRERKLRKDIRIAEQLSVLDPRTEAYNIRGFQGAFNRIRGEYARRVEDATRTGVELKSDSILLIDIDNFKTINDTYGHKTGDIVLKNLVKTVEECTRPGDEVGRLGGDEFGVILPKANEGEAKEIALELADEFKKSESGKNVSLSIGAFEIPAGYSLESALELADLPLYEAKEQGRDRVVTYTEYLERDLIISPSTLDT